VERFQRGGGNVELRFVTNDAMNGFDFSTLPLIYQLICYTKFFTGVTTNQYNNKIASIQPTAKAF
jgi:hypothetical protein